MSLYLPTREHCQQIIAEAEQRNPGPWVQHSYLVAQAAAVIAERCPGMDAQAAYCLGLLHDIGRREGVTDLRHTIDGCRYLIEQGYPDAARICLTHSFPYQHIEAGAGHWDCSAAELAWAANYLAACQYSLYDRLIQLCDAVSLATGFCLIEKRLIDVALRHGVNSYSVQKWQAFLDIQKQFETAIGLSIYALLPNVVQNTFGIETNAV